jgi:amidase
MDDIRACASEEGIVLGDATVDAMQVFVESMIGLLDVVEELPPLELGASVLGGREHRRPRQSEDPFNCFVHLCRIEGASSGALAGKKLAVKDNLAVAGVPISNGSRTVAYTPAVDAVVVERILAAGGTIIRKTEPR